MSKVQELRAEDFSFTGPLGSSGAWSAWWRAS